MLLDLSEQTLKPNYLFKAKDLCKKTIDLFLKSYLQLKIIDRKFRGTNFIYTLKTKNNDLIPVFVHSHHIHQHEVEENFGIKTPIYIDHLVCF